MSVKKTITFPDELAGQVEAISIVTDRSFSNYVIHAVRSEIKKQMSKYPGISERLKSGAGNSQSCKNKKEAENANP